MPFTAFFPAGSADTLLIDRLTTQGNLQGLLRHAVSGLQQVMRRGHFNIPPSVASATDRFRMEADPMRGFIEERIDSRHPNNAPFIARSDVYAAYVSWSALNGFHQMSANRFYESFIASVVDACEFPVRTVRINGINGFKGVCIRQ